MKQLFTYLFLVISATIIAQAPQSIPYQAVVRNTDGSVIANAAMTITFKIHDISATGTVVYEESHTTTTNTQGLISLNVGNGAVVSGTFSGINWGSGNKFLHVLMNAGSGVVDLGTQQMMSVPYAFYSKSSDVALSANNGYSRVSFYGDTLFFADNSFVIIPGISAANFQEGCTDVLACNYDALVELNDGSCLYISSPCNDGNVNTVNDTISSSCICIGKLKGCINPSACNYNALAEVDNGTCKFIGAVCNDNNSNTINDIINQNCVCAGVSVLPGNTTCQNEYISVTGCGGQDSLLYYDRYYSLVEIGGQCWFAENLATDKYANGDTIPTGLDNYTWINAISCAFAIYNDDLANDVIYGKLYNWFTTVDSRGVCPTGWHVPTDCDWMFLETSLGLSLQEVQSQGARGTDEGGALKSVSGWYGDNTGATNSSLFFALPGGVRSIYINNVGNSYGSILLNGVWWTSNSLSLLNAFSRSLTYEEATIDRNALNKTFGVSIRCIKD